MFSSTVVVAARRPTSKKNRAKSTKASTSLLKRPKLIWRKRDTQDSQLYNLRLDINDIKQEIARLNELRDLAVTQSLNRHDDLDGSCQKVVIEYFDVFAKGFAASPYNTRSFIYHALSEDIQVNNFQGREMVLEQWKNHSASFDNLDFRFVDGTVIPLGHNRAVVKCTAHFSSTITRQTFAIMFPHMLHREDLVKKLVGHTIADYGQYDFEIDATTMQITRCVVVLDFLGCFAKILKDPFEVAVLFGNTLPLDEFHTGDMDEGPRTPSILEVADSDDGGLTSVPETLSPASPHLQSPSAEPIKMRLNHILANNHVLEDAASSEGRDEAY